MIHKRDKKHAAHVSKIALRMMAVLVMSGDYIPACVMGMITERSTVVHCSARCTGARHTRPMGSTGTPKPGTMVSARICCIGLESERRN